MGIGDDRLIDRGTEKGAPEVAGHHRHTSTDPTEPVPGAQSGAEVGGHGRFSPDTADTGQGDEPDVEGHLFEMPTRPIRQ